MKFLFKLIRGNVVKYLRHLALMITFGLTACTSLSEGARNMNCGELQFEESQFKKDVKQYRREELAYSSRYNTRYDIRYNLFDDDLDSDAYTSGIMGDISSDDLEIIQREMARKGCRNSGY
ncbi:MAG: hypothetical protein ACWIPH_02815 [Ostreibacterium sp.]